MTILHFPNPNTPDPAHTATDRDGRPMAEFSGTYVMRGKEWFVPFWAYDMADALERAKQLGLDNVGQRIEEMPAW